MSAGPTLPLQDRVRFQSAGLFPRFLVLTAVLIAEMLILSVWFDNDALIARGGLCAIVGHWAAWAVRGSVGFAVLFATFAWLKVRAEILSLSSTAERAAPSLAFAGVHALWIAAFVDISRVLYSSHATWIPAGALLLLWLFAGLAALACAALAVLPMRLWSQLLRATGSLWAVTLALVVAACIAGNYVRLLWEPTAGLTFVLSKAVLTPFVSSVIADPATRILGTPNFDVQIAPECSGLEGVGLILAFSLCLLWLFRREFRFPRAYLLVPIGVVAIFLLNAVRIAALILIGNAGAPQIATGGFHSQAGWILFNAVALAYCVGATRISWLLKSESQRVPQTAPAARAATHATAHSFRASEANPAAACLLPFLAILAAGMIGTACGIHADWLYAARVPAAAIVLLYFRRSYASLNWKVSWLGPTVGVAVFALWIAADLSLTALHHTATDAAPSPLASSSTALRLGWIALRIASAVLTVPIAEELAFRGFLIRRLISADFDVLPLTRFTWPALLLSSLAFGLLHGRLWLPGTLAGLLYAFALLRRGRIGEAVAAHATTNALLAAFVLTTRQWHLWN